MMFIGAMDMEGNQLRSSNTFCNYRQKEAPRIDQIEPRSKFYNPQYMITSPDMCIHNSSPLCNKHIVVDRRVCLILEISIRKLQHATRLRCHKDVRSQRLRGRSMFSTLRKDVRHMMMGVKQSTTREDGYQSSLFEQKVPIRGRHGRRLIKIYLNISVYFH